ncbi:hypothetical protein AJ85_08735 [Alkalihalobacillus alcalophilus ATCC 27647 = CGMCC 1.3604]|uniref:Uncharacterized protein n=1 Tax=Alkalihalobacillus alcalophilus ATCC 27647 = CGMCC 1.3604 TaxID=1218173 RepID=A0A094WT03_ALKAL|nr:hypothetical protein [Alkalihalobacillus alcalophilus]KGA99193.1 hypothetical protein BALCAV_0200640 [Alkalihalobacillus alcalophilus ATCC 27647 = CGMCC 1.3604]MED1560381.1 hypothetical protein [Alkalihalobacillus alcalophilus]THG90798.1 hypothetical protein AJ85_08735 [Alkalihalobacillus alcalophilus ATCC 27647 = CGMCC 1.3604]
MDRDQSFVSTTLLKLLNEQTDLSGTQIDLIDGFLFMLKKIKRHKTIRLINEKEIHPRFWRSHNRAFGYETKNHINEREFRLLYEFYLNVAFKEGFVEGKREYIQVTEKGLVYLQRRKEEQLELLFQYIWG